MLTGTNSTKKIVAIIMTLLLAICLTRESFAAKWAIDNNYKREYPDALDWLK